MEYSVNEWGSEPFTNDDCWTGTDFATRAEAEERFIDLLNGHAGEGTAWIELDGPDVHKERPVPGFVKDEPGFNEALWEHRMLHGLRD